MEILAGVVIIILTVGLLRYQQVRKEQLARLEERKKEEAAHAEQRRLEECAKIVQLFLSEFGYICRDAITRDELKVLVDAGLSATALGSIIRNRIEALDAVELGTYDGTDFPIKLNDKYRDRHVYIVGKTGAGKTNLIRQMVFQDMARGEGLGIIAPEREMITDELLPFVPESRVDDVVYFNPADTAAPVSINPLYLDKDEDLDLRADENVSIFRGLLGNDATPRTNEILRQAFYALLPLPDTTLHDIPRLLDRENPHFRNQVISQLADTLLVDFWRETYPQFPSNAHLPIVYRLSRFTRPKYVRNVLCAPGRPISFRRIMDEGKIALFNLSDGLLGEETSQILGRLIVSKFRLAAMGRADTPPQERRRFFLYIDEFQSFVSVAGSSYEKILSRARKYRLALILAHQQTGQIPPSLLREILGNVSTTVSFVVSREDARRLAPGFISKTPSGDFKAIDPERLLALPVGHAFAKIGTTSFPMKTLLVSKKPDYDVKQQVIATSRTLYGARIDGQRVASPSEGDVPFDTSNPERTF